MWALSLTEKFEIQVWKQLRQNTNSMLQWARPVIVFDFSSSTRHGVNTVQLYDGKKYLWQRWNWHTWQNYFNTQHLKTRITETVFLLIKWFVAQSKNQTFLRFLLSDLENCTPNIQETCLYHTIQKLCVQLLCSYPFELTITIKCDILAKVNSTNRSLV